MGAFEIYTYGNGDFIAAVLNAVKIVLGGEDYITLIKISGIMGLLIVLLQGLSMQRVHWQWIIIYALVFYTLFLPKVNVGIIDRITPQYTQVVGDVPLGLGWFAHLTSTIGDGLTRMMEEAFALPEGMRYGNGGVGYNLNLMNESTRFTMPPSDLKTDIDAFLRNCTFYDLADGTLDPMTLTYSGNILEAINTDSVRFTSVHTAGNPIAVMMCKDAYPVITAAVNTAYPQIRDDLERMINGEVTATLETRLSEAYNTLGGISENGKDLIIQSFFINQLKESVQTAATLTGTNPALLSLSLAQSEQQQKISLVTIGELSKKMLPIVRNILEGMLYGLFPLIFLLILSPFSAKFFSAYIINLFWIQLWGPFFAILNLAINLKAASSITPFVGSAGYTLFTSPYLDASTENFIAVAGSMSLLVPVFAFGILKAGEFAFTQAIGMMTGSTQAAGSAAGGSVGLGNINYGNMALASQSYENISANKTSMGFKYDTGVDSNYFNHSWGQTSGGMVENRGVDSHPAMSYKTSSLPGFGMQLTNTFQNSLSEQRGEAERSGLTNTVSAGQEYSAALNTLNQFSSTRAKGSNNQSSTQLSETFQESSSLQTLDSISTSLSKTHNISEGDARAVVGKAFADLSIGGKFFIKGNAGTGITNSHTNNASIDKAYNDAVSQMSKQDVGKMKQEMQSYATQHSTGETDSENASFASSISAHLNNAAKHSEQAQESYSKAQSLDKTASRMKSDTFAMSDDLSVRFSNWLLDEHKGDTNAYRMDMDVMAVNTEYREHKINDFLSKHNETLLNDINSINRIAKPNADINNLPSDISSVTDTYSNAMNKINQEKKSSGLSSHFPSADIPTPSAKTAFADDTNTIKQNMDISTQELSTEKQAEEERIKDKTTILPDILKQKESK